MVTLKNPKIYITTPEPTPYERLQKSKRIAGIIFVATFAIGLFWLLFFSPIFAVSEIIIDGPATPEMERRFEEFVGQNIFMLDAERLERDLRTQYPFLKKIIIFRGLPNALKIEVVTRKEVLIWESAGQHFLVDQDGVPFAKVTNEEAGSLSAMPVVYDLKAAPVNLGSLHISPDFIDFVLALHGRFSSTTGVGLSFLRVNETTLQVEAVTDRGFSIFFDTTRSPERQLTALKRVLDSYSDKIHEYVDLRVAGKAYLK